MQGLGPASESLRIAEHYRQMADGELIKLAQDPSALTEMAQDALKQEMSSRRLTIPPLESPPQPEPPQDYPEPDSPYAEERELATVCTVFSFRDAFQVQNILDLAGIPFYIGPEKATVVDAVTSNYGEGLDVKVMRVGFPWALRAITKSYEPKDEPPEEKVNLEDEVAIRCPRCGSEDVVFEQLNADSIGASSAPAKFQWRCDSCGNDWEDEGIAK